MNKPKPRLPFLHPRSCLGVITGFSLLATTTLLSAEQAAYSFTGTAADNNGEPIYKEVHRIEGSCEEGLFSPRSHSVTYTPPGDSGEPIASKQMDYSESPLRPSFTMKQPGFDETMKVTNQNDETITIRWDEPNGEIHENRLDITSDMVFDSGFIYLIEKNWQKLNAGDEISFRFLSSTRAETYEFVASRAQDARIDAHLTIRLQPAGTILGWVVDPITLGFDEKGRLTHYAGLTNLRKNGDENYDANIRYETPTLPCAVVETAE